MRNRALKTPRLAVVALVVGAMVMAACSSSSKSSSSSAAAGGSATTAPTFSGAPFNVFAILPQTGALADYGYAFENSLKVAANEINAAGGVLGRQMKLEFADSQGNATQAVSVLQQRLANGSKPDVVWASVTSSEGLAMLPTLTTQKILTLGIQAAASVADPTKYPYYFSGSVDATLFPKFVASELQKKGYKKVAVLTGNDAVGKSVATSYDSVLTAAGFQVSADSYGTSDIDMSAPLQRLQAKNPDVLLVDGLGAAPSYILKSRTKVGVTTPTYVDQSTSNDLGSLVTPADLNNVSLLTWAFNVVPSNPSAKYTAFLNAMKALGPIKGVWILNAWPHDLLWALVVGIKQANSTDPAAVKAAMENLQWPADSPSISFPSYKFSSTSHFQTGSIENYTAASLKPWSDGRYLPVGS